ncbi:MAG: cyclic dehypoxanthinyl futalosine synthase [Thermoplasmata archaeon]|jgi:cyclic dehypoxanthinyl futalosine synthase|nr:cyclic dehypoxanthinyl futalosine synthase [Thermoplasmata archaeon]
MSVQALLDKAVAGGRLTPEEGVAIAQAPFLDLAAAANARRNAVTDPRVVTYVVDRNINYTNVCNVLCDFCGFYRTGKEKDAYTLRIEQVLEKIAPLVAMGGTQVLLQGGLNPDLPMSYLLDLFRAVRERYPTVDVHSLTATEIEFYAKQEGLTFRETIERFREAGLKSLPGGGMEIMSDEIRDRVSPLKTRSAQYMEIHHECHELGMTSTATMMFGMGETWAHRVEHLDRVRAVQDQADAIGQRGFTAFIPWTFKTDGSTRMKVSHATTEDYLRVIALSRLYLDNVRNVQSGWVTEGPKIAQVALACGANDWGGVLMEENVISAAGTLFGMDPPAARRYIREGGYVPAQRDTYYNLLRRFDEATPDERPASGTIGVHLGKVGNRGRGVPIRIGSAGAETNPS